MSLYSSGIYIITPRYRINGSCGVSRAVDFLESSIADNLVEVIYPKKYKFLFLKLLKLIFITNKNNLFIINCIYPFFSILFLIFCNIFSFNYLIINHGNISAWNLRSTKKLLFYKIFCKYVIKRSNAYLYTSKDEVIDNFGNFHKFFFPLELNYFYNQNNRIREVIFAGRISKEKNLDTLVKSFENISDSRFSLRIFGTIENKDYFKSLGIDKYYEGFIDRQSLLSILSQAWCCVVPSHSESFSFLIGESLSSGCPVICTSVTDWAIDKVGCGFVYNSSYNSMDKLLLAAMNLTESEVIKMGIKGQLHIKDHYSVDKFKIRLYNIINSL